MLVPRGRDPVGKVTEARLGENWASDGDRLMRRRVREVMGPSLPVVEGTETLEVVPWLLGYQKAVLVPLGPRVDGIVTRADMLAPQRGLNPSIPGSVHGRVLTGRVLSPHSGKALSIFMWMPNDGGGRGSPHRPAHTARGQGPSLRP